MACQSCAEKAKLGLLGLAKGIFYGPADPQTAKARLELCRACFDRDSAGERLFRQSGGKSYCGVPRLSAVTKIWRNEYTEGCGCELVYKTSRREAACPRGRWSEVEQKQEAAPKDGTVETIITAGFSVETIIAAACALAGYCATGGSPTSGENASANTLAGQPAVARRRVAWAVPALYLPLASLFPVAEQLVAAEGHGVPPHARALLPRAGTPAPEVFGEILGAEPQLPKLSFSAETLAWLSNAHGLERKQTVVLAPLTPGTSQTWPLRRWLELEERLMHAGFGTVVLDPDKHGQHTHHFRSVRHFALNHEQTAALVSRASLVVGGDPAALLLAGVQEIPALALCGPQPPEEMFGWYSSIETLGADYVECTGCRKAPGTAYTRFCEIACEAFNALPLAVVDDAARALLTAQN